MSTLPYNEFGVYKINFIQPFEIKIAFVKNIIRMWFIWNLIHKVHIMDTGRRNVEVYRYMSCNIKYDMSFYSGFGLSKKCPPKVSEAEIYCGGVNSIKMAVNRER